jgi:DivIVA domain-containing protein
MRGYSRQQVDDLFTRIAAGLVTPEELRPADFKKQMGGYDPHQVDEELATILQDLEK